MQTSVLASGPINEPWGTKCDLDLKIKGQDHNANVLNIYITANSIGDFMTSYKLTDFYPFFSKFKAIKTYNYYSMFKCIRKVVFSLYKLLNTWQLKYFC